MPVSTTEQEIKEELKQKGCALHHIIRLKRNGGKPMPPLRFCQRQKNPSKYLMSMGFWAVNQSQSSKELSIDRTVSPLSEVWTCSVVLYRFTKVFEMCPGPHDTSVPSNKTRGTQMCQLCGNHPANSPTCRFTPRRNLQVIAQRQTISFADAAKVASLAAPPASSSPSTAQSVDLATALKSLQQIISPLTSATQALQAILPVNV
nr:unnamed protein product [Callosobruchus chinensis]